MSKQNLNLLEKPYSEVKAMFPVLSFLYLIPSFLLSGLIVYIIIPKIIKSCRAHGLMVPDAHKPDKPEVAEAGGISILIAFTFSILLIVLLQSILTEIISDQAFEELFGITATALVNHNLLAAVLSVVIAGLIGFLDDVFKIRWRSKILLGFLPALPLMALRAWKSTVYIPLFGIGAVPFGLLYPLVIIPLAVNFAFNSYNMVAGMNGLETGLGIISLSTILVAAIIPPLILPEYPVNLDVIIFVICLIGALVVFLRYNWTPAKIFVGDTGTLTIGTAIIVALVIGNMEWLAVGIFLIYLLNFLLFFVYLLTKQEAKLATVDEEGNLVAPCPYTVYWIIPYFRKGTTEKQNVLALFGIQTLTCIFGLLLFLSAAI
ncbi:MAG: hypothetical protein ACFFBD_13570 [Candidatus Hodarchaeota archaeon]